MSTFIKNSTKVINDSVKLVRKTENQFRKNQCLEQSRTNFLKEDKRTKTQIVLDVAKAQNKKVIDIKMSKE